MARIFLAIAAPRVINNIPAELQRGIFSVDRATIQTNVVDPVGIYDRAIRDLHGTIAGVVDSVQCSSLCCH